MQKITGEMPKNVNIWFKKKNHEKIKNFLQKCVDKSKIPAIIKSYRRDTQTIPNKHRRKGQCTKDNGIKKYNTEVETIGQHSLKRTHQERFDVSSSRIQKYFLIL